MECVAVCNDDALRPVVQTEESVARLRKEWDFWTDLPNTPDKYNRIDDLEEKIGPEEAKRYEAMRFFRKFVMQNYRIVRVFGEHVLFELKSPTQVQDVLPKKKPKPKPQ